jgi:pimeloyl-ACP methyl ester carboxylesterase
LSTSIARQSTVRYTADRKGSGRPIVYLHGFLGEGIGTPAIDRLAEDGFEVVRPALPGFSSLDELEGIDNFEDLCFWLDDVLDAEDLDSPAIVGTCLGGWLAAEYAVRNPSRVEKLVLTGAPGIQTSNARPAEFFGVPFADMAELLFFDQSQPFAQIMKAASVVSNRPVASPEAVLPFLRSLAATARFAWNPYFFDPKLEARLSRITCQTLVIWGADDKFLSPEIGQAWAGAIPEARFVVFEGCGHFPPLEKGDNWAREVLDFLGT